MQNQIAGAIVRLHGPLNLRLWDAIARAIGVAFLALGAYLLVVDDQVPAAVALLGGLFLLADVARQRRRHDLAVWAMAAAEDDPVRALCLHEYLYRLRWRDLLVVADWRCQREADGLSVWDDEDPEAPPQVRAIWRHLDTFPREVDT